MATRRTTQALIWGAGILAAAALVIVLTGQTPARIKYDIALERAEDAVSARQKATAERFKLGTYERYDWSQDSRRIVFSSGGVPKVVADVQFVGSYSATSKTWLWAWANESIADNLVQDSLRVKQFGEEGGLDRLVTRKWPATTGGRWRRSSQPSRTRTSRTGRRSVRVKSISR